jgi:translation initiation factor RLI1
LLSLTCFICSCLCRFASVEDLGSPDEAAARILDKYLNKEFMSTRIGIKREGEIVSAASRQGSDGKLYYDIEVIRSSCRTY